MFWECFLCHDLLVNILVSSARQNGRQNPIDLHWIECGHFFWLGPVSNQQTHMLFQFVFLNFFSTSFKITTASYINSQHKLTPLTSDLFCEEGNAALPAGANLTPALFSSRCCSGISQGRAAAGRVTGQRDGGDRGQQGWRSCHTSSYETGLIQPRLSDNYCHITAVTNNQSSFTNTPASAVGTADQTWNAPLS